MSSKKVCIIDCQVFQTPAWHRGMGKYSFELLKEMHSRSSYSTDQEVVLLLNSNLSTPEDALISINNNFKKFKIQYIDLLQRRETDFLPDLIEKNRQRLNTYIQDNYENKTIEYLILSLFLVENAAGFPDNVEKSLIVYDLIMLQYFQMYLGFGPSAQHFGHYKTLFSADKLYTISKTVANDLTNMVGINSNKIINIDGGAIERKTFSLSKNTKQDSPVDAQYILMPTGGDYRKNNIRCVKAFESFNKKNNEKYKLVLTSTFSPQLIAQINKISKNVIFTGNLTEEKLAAYYEYAEIILFASEYEGLGLPILEAVDHERPVVCSDIPVFREISTEAFYFCDPYNIQSIEDAISAAVSGSINKAEYIRIAKKYSWKNTVDSVLNTKTKELNSSSITEKAKKLLISPNFATGGLISRYLANQFPEEFDKNQVEYYLDMGIKQRPRRPNHIAYSANCHNIEELSSKIASQYQDVVINLTDSSLSVVSLLKALSLDNVEVNLYTHNIKKLFDIALDIGYLSENRYEAEKKLHEDLKQKDLGCVWVVSLLNNAKKVVVYDTSLMLKLQKIVKQYNLDTILEKGRLSVSAPKYRIPKLENGKEGLYIENLSQLQAAVGSGKLPNKSMILFMDGVEISKYYRECGVDYPLLVPVEQTTDHNLQIFFQNISTLYVSLDDKVKLDLIEEYGKLNGIKVISI